MKNSIYLNPNELIFNEFKTSVLSCTPRNYEDIKQCVEIFGILTPLMVTRNHVVISGNVRLKIALELGLKLVPVNYCDIRPDDIQQILSCDVVREKTLYEKFLIHELLLSKLKIRQGQRTDLNVEKKREKQFFEDINPLNKSVRNKTQRVIKYHGKEGGHKIIKDISDGKTNFNQEINKINSRRHNLPKEEVDNQIIEYVFKTENVILLDSIFDEISIPRINTVIKEGSILVPSDPNRKWSDFYKRIRILGLELFNQYVDKQGVTFYHLIFRGSKILPDLELGEITDIEDVIGHLNYPVKQVA
jgi:hypothetical protein